MCKLFAKKYPFKFWVYFHPTTKNYLFSLMVF